MPFDPVLIAVATFLVHTVTTHGICHRWTVTPIAGPVTVVVGDGTFYSTVLRWTHRYGTQLLHLVFTFGWFVDSPGRTARYAFPCCVLARTTVLHYRTCLVTPTPQLRTARTRCIANTRAQFPCRVTLTQHLRCATPRFVSYRCYCFVPPPIYTPRSPCPPVARCPTFTFTRARYPSCNCDYPFNYMTPFLPAGLRIHTFAHVTHVAVTRILPVCIWLPRFQLPRSRLDLRLPVLPGRFLHLPAPRTYPAPPHSMPPTTLP